MLDAVELNDAIIANDSGAGLPVTSLHGDDAEEKESSGGCQGRSDEFNVHIHFVCSISLCNHPGRAGLPNFLRACSY